MNFYKEPTGYFKTALSELQGAWEMLREAVVEEFGFQNSDKLLFHIDEAMSWESVRNLNLMEPLILLIHNIAKQSDASKSITECIDDVRNSFDAVIEAMKEGKVQ
ncbi:MAG: hypothetical protein JRI53_07355 [Deltaproteobacteria bacterium]|nr:hypothetical protein [Deltaproteobacteria bacterium]MBW1846889.1 hypothetical protein [Deltaproteobacteria bacterium]MBW1984522.1 hypothetical protein [Deltaproteobacteria bacterium]